MASVFERKNKDGSTSFRVQIRRKGLKSFSTCFAYESDAWKFVNECEQKYCLDPENFNFDRLKRIRMNEFSRT